MYLYVHDDEAGRAVELCPDADEPDGVGELGDAGGHGVEGEAGEVEEEQEGVGPATAQLLLKT